MRRVRLGVEHLGRFASPQGHGLRVVASIVDVLERSDAFLGDDVVAHLAGSLSAPLTWSQSHDRPPCLKPE